MKKLEQLAREAGGFVGPNAEGLWMFEPDDLARFRAACRAEALEEAAQLIDTRKQAIWAYHEPPVLSAALSVCDNLATAIREMK